MGSRFSLKWHGQDECNVPLFKRWHHMNFKIVTAFLFSLSLMGCTGTEMVVKPDPNTQLTSVSKRFQSVGVKPKSADYPAYAGAGNMADGFANTIEESGFSKQVFYPLRPADEPEIVFDSQFSARADTHSGANFAKAFFTGFTLFLLEPVIWFNYDYILEANVAVLKRGERIQTINARSDVNLSAKWLSLSDIQRMEPEGLTKAKRALYYQILKDVH